MDQNAFLISAGEQLKNFGSFLNSYDQNLTRLLETTLGGSDKARSITDKLIEVNYSVDQEELPLMRLLESERMLNKTLLTFAYLCSEVDLIVKDARRMQTKFLCADEDLCVASGNASTPSDSAAKQSNERILLAMSSHMEFLFRVQFLLQRCTVLANNLLHQCGAFMMDDCATLEFKFTDVFDCLAELVLQLMIFDEILATSNFCRFWATYKKTVDAISRNRKSSQAFCTAPELNGVRNCLLELDYLFSGAVFRSYLDSTFSMKDKLTPKGMGQLIQQCNDYIKQGLAAVDKFNLNDLDDLNEPRLLVRLNVICVVFHDFCGQIDSKHVRHMLELNCKHQGIMLVGNVPWRATAFLKHHAGTLVKPHEKLLLDPRQQQKDYLNSRVQTLQRDCRTYCTQISLWALNMRSALSTGSFDLNVEQFKELARLLLLGLHYAGQISFLVKAVVNAHVALQTAMTKSILLAVCKLIEMLKIIQLTFQDHTEGISKVMQCILQYLQYKMLNLLALCKKKVTSSKLQDRNVDALAAIKIAEKCMSGPSSSARILVTKLAVNATNSNNRTLAPEEYGRFTVLMTRIQTLSTFQLNVRYVCDTSFIYWHQSILSAYLKQIVNRKLDFNSFQYIVSSSDSCAKKLKLQNADDLKGAELLQKSNFESIRNDIVSNLCGQIETFLRLEVHSSLQLEKMDPFENGINDYRDLINMCPVEVNGRYIILKDHVENYLSGMFYNLTTISLHDWKKYEEMRHLACKRLSLKPVEDYLPNQTLEQGIDILEIMRKIHIFVSKYVYNMNSQIFVEQQSANKHLDSIGIRHVANSLRTHGSGVINTTVNFTYQFLRQKFYTFSQFLYDEQIKSRLMKELRAFGERKQSNRSPLYPFERADAFNKEVRKLGLSNDGQTYMDLFRKVITHVGNAMGYIRLVRSGNIHANYSASLYLPKFDEELKFVQKCKEQQLQNVTVAAAENCEVNISNLAKSFSDSTDYFKLLLEAFYPFFQNPHNMHLKNFFLIVPPLTLNYVEHMLSAKEKIKKKDHQKTVLFDDGFAVGLAYILKLLNQITDFNSLQWFGTVRERFETERRKIQEMHEEIKATSNKKSTKTAIQQSENEKLQQTLALTERRINAHQREYSLLYYNLSSAKIFFQ